MKKILAVVMALVLSLSMVPPVHAQSYVSKANFWSWMASQHGLIPELVGAVIGSACSVSDDGQHHSDGYLYEEGDGEYIAVCSYCGDRVVVYGNNLPDYHDSYTSSLPASVYGSDGKLYLYPKVTSIKLATASTSYWTVSDIKNYRDGIEFNGISNGGTIRRIYIQYDSVTIPAHCSYTVVFSGYTINVRCRDDSGYVNYSNRILESSKGSSVYNSSVLNYKPGEKYASVSFSAVFDSTFSGSLDGALWIEVLPDSVAPEFSIDNRPTSFNNSGNLAVQTGDGNLSIIDHQNIVDETNNTYYNPVTQTDNSITSWSYDYSNRSYSLTLDNGQTVTVTYGDENITINEGDTVYNVYYVYTGTDPDPTPTPTPGGGGGDTHQHNYTSEDTKAPTCTMPGVRTFTCSECGDTYTKSIPATGHDWQVKTEVKTEYGEDGELLQEGYIIYQCSVCGEEYKATAQTGPPPSGGGGSGDDDDGGGSGIGDALADLFGVIGDLLTGLFGGAIELLGGVLGGLVDLFKSLLSFVTGFTDFLTAAFAFLPSEMLQALSAGIILMVIIAIVKFIGGFL